MEKTIDKKNPSNTNSKLDLFIYNLLNKFHKLLFKEDINPCGPFTKKFNNQKYTEYINLYTEPIESVLPLRDSNGKINLYRQSTWPIIEAKYVVNGDLCGLKVYYDSVVYKEKNINRYYLVYDKYIESGILPIFKIKQNHIFIANSPEEAVEEAKSFLRNLKDK